MTLNPVTVIESGDVWTIAVNRNQNLLGKTMLVLQRPCAAVTELSTDEWVELHRQLRRVCAAIDGLFAPDLYNHAFLMNEDRQVHLHVVPRYKSERSWSGKTFTDQRVSLPSDLLEYLGLDTGDKVYLMVNPDRAGTLVLLTPSVMRDVVMKGWASL